MNKVIFLASKTLQMSFEFCANWFQVCKENMLPYHTLKKEENTSNKKSLNEKMCSVVANEEIQVNFDFILKSDVCFNIWKVIYSL